MAGYKPGPGTAAYASQRRYVTSLRRAASTIAQSACGTGIRNPSVPSTGAAVRSKLILSVELATCHWRMPPGLVILTYEPE
jgi:hypothetical protein